jgi:nucleoside-diphosphate-sugar epimerase
MKDLAERVLSIFHQKENHFISYKGEDPQEDFRGIYPIRSARQHLGYEPQTGLEEGLCRSAKGWDLL